MNNFKKVCALLSMMFSCLFSITANAENDEPTEPGDTVFGLGWLEQTRNYSAIKADDLAKQLDRFFGVPRSDLEAAYSSIRIIPELRWQENGEIESHLRVRGRLHLPRLNERISIILSEDKGEGSDYYTQDTIFAEPQSTRVNVEVKLKEKERFRFDFRVGLRSNLKLRTSIRYRYEAPWSDKLSNRLSETVYFIDGKGFGSFTEYQLDHLLASNSLIRWSSEYRHEEKLSGDEWGTSLTHASYFNDKGGLSYFVRMAGTTNHSYIDTYQIGIRLRRNFVHPWLFWEFSPGYQWEKINESSPREGSLFAIMKLEMAIGRQ